MAANSPDAPLNTAEIQELRRLIAARQRSGSSTNSLTVTLIGVFAAGLLAFIGWLALETQTNGKAIVALRTDVAILKADVAELKTGQGELKTGLAELRGGQRELKAILLEQRRQ